MQASTGPHFTQSLARSELVRSLTRTPLHFCPAQVQLLLGCSSAQLQHLLTVSDVRPRFEAKPEVLQCFQLLNALPWDATDTITISSSNARLLMRTHILSEAYVQTFKAASEQAGVPVPAYPTQQPGAQLGGQATQAPGTTTGGTRIIAAARMQLHIQLPEDIPDLPDYDPEEDVWEYGLKSVPAKLDMELDSLEVWSTKPFHMPRGTEYAAAAQDSTMSSMLACIKGYMGFAQGYGGKARDELSLQLYSDPQLFVQFIAYLRKRGLSKASLVKHITVARKVVFYLSSSLLAGSPWREQLMEIRSWMATMEAQINLTMPEPEPKRLPEFDNVLSWVDSLSDLAIGKVTYALRKFGKMTRDSSEAVQHAVLAHLITGASFPVVRLDLIRTLRHPDRKQCDDSNCLKRRLQGDDACKGNRLEILQDGVAGRWSQAFGAGTIRLHIAHGKNDRRKSRANYKVSFDLPAGDLTDLLRAHIKQGCAVLSRSKRPIKLFVSPTGLRFDKSNICSYWKQQVMETSLQFGVQPCPPTHFRTLFVENFTCSEGGAPEELWEGAAIIMGNSVPTWNSSYYPSRRRRMARNTVKAYNSFIQKHRQVQNEEEEEREQEEEQEDYE